MPFLDYDVEIRRIICSTNAIESLNARYRRAISKVQLARSKAGEPDPTALIFPDWAAMRLTELLDPGGDVSDQATK